MNFESAKETMKIGNLYQQIPDDLPTEIVECLHKADGLRIERIVSRGHQSGTGFWYEQSEHEWVLLIAGEARLRLREGDQIVHLRPGSYLNIPAQVQHRVDWTIEGQDTIWLAVFHSAPDCGG